MINETVSIEEKLKNTIKNTKLKIIFKFVYEYKKKIEKTKRGEKKKNFYKFILLLKIYFSL